ncbi:hypothetical protein [Microbispora sp. NBRC 16548]|uniref:hypothetical protein n=1 Tax=Microbispora sp. NBRC 16548 TaxID=3030994 RepID=UPI002556EB7F|nr:hypothetical protein [Microbispora sp. NBRC 16548]
MTRNRRHKRDTRQHARATGTSYQRALYETRGHEHPAPDLTILADLPYPAGRPVNVPLAAKMVGACRAGCGPCQDDLFPELLADRATVAALAGAVYGLVPVVGMLASPTTSAWQDLARYVKEHPGSADAVDALSLMSDEEAGDLLNDTLDHWSVAGADISIVTADVPEPGSVPGDEPPAPAYAVCPGTVHAGGGPLPMLVLVPETPGAGTDDIRDRCGWPAWDMSTLPPMDPDWRLRMDIATRSAQTIAHLDAAGWDDLILWQASETVSLPPVWFDLVDQKEHVLLIGPADDPSDEALRRAAAAGDLMAIVARVRFL